MIEKTSYLLLSTFGELIAILAVGINDLGALGSLVVFIGGILVSAGVFMATTKVTMKNVKQDLEDQKQATSNQEKRIAGNEKQVELLRQLLETKHNAILDKLDGMRAEMKGYVEVGNVKKEKYEENLQHIWKAIDKIEKKIHD